MPPPLRPRRGNDLKTGANGADRGNGTDKRVVGADAQSGRDVERHLEGILAHWQQGLTTAFMEGLNSLFSAVKPAGTRLPFPGVSDRHALLRRGQTEIPYYAK